MKDAPHAIRHAARPGDVGVRRGCASAALLALCLVTAGHASAQSVTPERTTGDPRLRTVLYRENQVVLLRGYIGYQMMIEFDRAERIENVSIGDSAGWQVTPNRAATLLFLKPIVMGAATNMTVVTTLRRYTFELVTRETTSSNDPRIMYNVRFAYPAPPTRPAPGPPRDPALEAINLNYRITGARDVGPARVFDNGRATYFQFADGQDTPAIFLLGPDNKEELVNAQARGPYVVVDQIAPAFVVRRGRHRAVVRNDAPRVTAAPRAAAPQ